MFVATTGLLHCFGITGIRSVIINRLKKSTVGIGVVLERFWSTILRWPESSRGLVSISFSMQFCHSYLVLFVLIVGLYLPVGCIKMIRLGILIRPEKENVSDIIKKTMVFLNQFFRTALCRYIIKS